MDLGFTGVLGYSLLILLYNGDLMVTSIAEVKDQQITYRVTALLFRTFPNSASSAYTDSLRSLVAALRRAVAIERLLMGYLILFLTVPTKGA
jgi:heptaprenylglyceryl phosphate synthase